MVKIVLGVLIVVMLSAISSLLIVMAFLKGYYLELDEMTLVLIVAAILAIYWNTTDGKQTER